MNKKIKVLIEGEGIKYLTQEEIEQLDPESTRWSIEEENFTQITLGKLLSSKNLTIRRNAISILKQLQNR